MIIVKETAVIRVQALHPPDPSQSRVLICFTGVGHHMGGMDVQRPEFFSASNRFDNVLFFSDLTRSWGNAYDLGAELDALAPYLNGRRLFTLGNSMGGTLAILAAHTHPIEACAALVPQFSVHPDIMPDETRWQEYRQSIRNWPVPSLEGCFNRQTRYGILSANAPEETQHWQRFPQASNITHLVPQPSDHMMAQALKRDGHLQPILAAFWDGTLDAAFLKTELKRDILTLSPQSKPSWLGRWRQSQASA